MGSHSKFMFWQVPGRMFEWEIHLWFFESVFFPCETIVFEVMVIYI